MKHELPKYSKDHQVGMKVPKGGSDCAKCEYVGSSTDGPTCGQKDFVKWNGSNKLPAPPNEYCCDFFTWQKRTTMRSAKELRQEK
jgi:hypothetical protein